MTNVAYVLYKSSSASLLLLLPLPVCRCAAATAAGELWIARAAITPTTALQWQEHRKQGMLLCKPQHAASATGACSRICHHSDGPDNRVQLGSHCLATCTPEQLRVAQPGVPSFPYTFQQAHKPSQLLPAAWGSPQAGHKHAACVLHRQLHANTLHAARKSKEGARRFW